MLFAVTAFRPDRAADSTLLLNDMTWIFLVVPWPPFTMQNFAFAFVILSDTRTTPLFPRWLGYLNIWAPIIFTPGVILPFFKSGPFACHVHHCFRCRRDLRRRAPGPQNDEHHDLPRRAVGPAQGSPRRKGLCPS